MHKVTFGGANSVDNYIARLDHAVDWLMWGDEAAGAMADYWKTLDTVLMGRKTYEVAVRSGQGGSYACDFSREIARFRQSVYFESFRNALSTLRVGR